MSERRRMPATEIVSIHWSVDEQESARVCEGLQSIMDSLTPEQIDILDTVIDLAYDKGALDESGQDF